MATIRRRFGKWQVQIRKQQHPLITKTFLSKKNAEQWVREIENEIDKGTLNLDKKENTLRELIDRYIDEISSKKNGSDNEKIILKAFQREKFVNYSVLKITSEHFAKYRDKRLVKVKPATLLRELCIIQHLYNIANKEWGFEIKNPILNIRKPTISNRRERRLTEYEYNFLVKGNYPQQTLRHIIELAIETAMRRGEILNIKPEHIKGQTLLIPKTKNGHPRTIPLTKRALYILENTQLPFPMSANAVRLAWDRLKKKGNIKDLHFHDLRHEAISRFFEKGLSIPEVALISGHKDVRMLFRYTHLKAEDILRKL
ncbi:MAG: site-specific integrase [Candidatus Woesearchaeota archaeon]|jgi:integrase|nr:site-specific integrase [Candidatus Woesearchaeota archaeon]